MKAMSRDKFLILAGIATLTLAALAGLAGAQTPDSAHMAGMADHAMSNMHGPMDVNMMKHMELTPLRAATPADSVRARKLVAELKHGIAGYQDTTTAVADGYKMF